MQSTYLNYPHKEGVIDIADLFDAYASCRKNKRNSVNALKFELDYEHQLIKLWEEIHSGHYRPGRSIAFVIGKSVKREIFAADFRDRVVHHFVINKLNPLFERIFIKDSYACRKNKGVQAGIAYSDASGSLIPSDVDHYSEVSGSVIPNDVDHSEPKI